MTTHNADHTQRRPAGVACLNVGVGELGAGGLLGSTSAGVGDGGGYCCCWFAVMVAVSAVATSPLTSPAGTISTSPARGCFRPDVLSARRYLLRRVRFSGRRVGLPLSDKPTANRAAVM